MPKWIVTETCEWVCYAPTEEEARSKVAHAIMSTDPDVQPLSVTYRTAEEVPEPLEADPCPTCNGETYDCMDGPCDNCEGTGTVPPTARQALWTCVDAIASTGAPDND